jgi:hypothetical protein
MTDGELRISVRIGASALDLDENQRLSFLGHNIDLTEKTSVVSFNDPVTGFRKIGCRQFFAPFPRAYPHERHGCLPENQR